MLQEMNEDYEKWKTRSRRAPSIIMPTTCRQAPTPFGLKAKQHYQSWYTASHAVIRELIPHRLPEFQQLYMGDGSRRRHLDLRTYTIQDWLDGFVNSDFDYRMAVYRRMYVQWQILSAARERLDTVVLDLKRIVQAEVFDSELGAARELADRGYLRPAGVVAGVVLERHLAEVASSHGLESGKNRPTINDYNELLRVNGVLDVPPWRQIAWLGDIRNLCAHDRGREPRPDEVADMIAGVEKLVATLP